MCVAMYIGTNAQPQGTNATRPLENITGKSKHDISYMFTSTL